MNRSTLTKITATLAALALIAFLWQALQTSHVEQPLGNDIVSAAEQKQLLPHEQAIALLNQDKVEAAEKLLRDELKQHPTDQPVRILLGQVLDYDGRPDEAIAIWTAGISQSPTDFPLWMQIGSLQARRGTEGPNEKHYRRTVTTSPDRNPGESAKFKTEHLQLAATAFQKAIDLATDDPAPIAALANVYAEMNDHKAAVTVWQKVYDQSPKNLNAAQGLATALAKSNQPERAVAVLEKTIEAHPRLAPALTLLAECYQSLGREDDALRTKQLADFYAALPPFTRLECTDAVREKLKQLNDKSAVDRLCADPSDEATQLLAVLCWSHPHNALEEQAFDSLAERGKSATPVVRQLVQHANSTCTMRSACRILAQQKDPAIFDRLVRLLPGDTRTPGFDMDIAGSLDTLGDPRAVPHLIEVLAPSDRTSASNDPGERFMNERPTARLRAAFALGAFDTPPSKQALEQGLANPELAAACAASLYRLTRDNKHLAKLTSTLKTADPLTAYVVRQYLTKIDTPEAANLATELKDLEENRRSKAQRNETK